MKMILVVGIALMIAGVLAFAYGGFTYTTRETVAEVGSLKISVDQAHHLSPMTVGGVALGAGIVLLLVGTKPWLRS